MHLCSGPQGSIPLVRLKSMIESILRQNGASLPRAVRVPPRLFRMLTRLLELLVDDKTRRALRTLPVFLDYLESDQGFANMRTAATLGAAGIPWPVADEYLPRVLDHYCAGRTPGDTGVAR
jgi:hypothetical protein